MVINKSETVRVGRVRIKRERCKGYKIGLSRQRLKLTLVGVQGNPPTNKLGVPLSLGATITICIIFNVKLPQPA